MPTTDKWAIAFYWRPSMSEAPGIAFLRSCPSPVEKNLTATVIAVVDGPPPSFPVGSLLWRPMRGAMAGIYEIRDRHGDQLYRLFCLLDPQATRYGMAAPLLVILCGGTKAVRTAMDNDVYEAACMCRQDYLSSNPRAILP